MGRCQGQYGNGNRGTGHINRSAQGNGNGIGIRIQSQPFAERQIHRDIGCRASGEKRIDPAFPKGGKNQGIGILMNLQKDDKRIHHKGHQEIGTDKNCQELGIPQKGSQTGASNRICNEAHDPQRCEVDDPGHHLCNSCRNIIEAQPGGFTGSLLQGNSKNYSPGQNTDVIGVQKRGNRIIHDTENQGMKHRHNTAWRRQLRIRCHLELQKCRKQERHGHSHQGSTECGYHVQFNHRFHPAPWSLLLLGHGVHDQEEHKNRRHSLQSLDEEIPEDFYHRDGGLEENSDNNAHHKAYGDLLNQRHPGNPFLYSFHKILLTPCTTYPKFPFRAKPKPIPPRQEWVPTTGQVYSLSVYNAINLLLNYFLV